ncbi:hypothetical protein EUX48_02295 [Haemophilus haemolyticus]|uniref:Uncharacterized protein n=2 Tax=Haemophilus haemolyticus TaxID=726 RepID=A0A502LKU1_HAEHA|nr:hypothetical protein EUX48_02295 [Haemophilus haemolyticus]
MKVLDEHILEYIWDKTLDRIAQGTLVTYIGGSVGPNSFVINSDVVKDAAVQAARCWRAIGVPYGMDDSGKAFKSLPINALPRSIFELKTNCYRILRSKYPSYKGKGVGNEQ